MNHLENVQKDVYSVMITIIANNVLLLLTLMNLLMNAYASSITMLQLRMEDVLKRKEITQLRFS